MDYVDTVLSRNLFKELIKFFKFIRDGDFSISNIPSFIVNCLMLCIISVLIVLLIKRINK